MLKINGRGEFFNRLFAVGVCRRAGVPSKRPQYAAVRPFRVHEPWKQRLHRQAVDIAGMDACQKRFGQVGDRLAAETPSDERADRLVAAHTGDCVERA